MILLAGFLEVVFKAWALVGFTVAVGGVVFMVAVLRPTSTGSLAAEGGARRAAAVIAAGGFLLSLSHLAVLFIEPWALADEMGRWPLADFLDTSFARATLIQAAVGVVLAAAALGLRERPTDTGLLAQTILVATGLAIAGAWSVHGTSRISGRGLLMAVTVLHQAGAAVWGGGVIHLVLLWRLVRRDRELLSDWPLFVARFSRLAAGGMTLILLSGIVLCLRYVRVWDALIGTAYGSMVTAKIVLLLAALLLGGMNVLLIRQWRRGRAEGVTSFLPYFAEAESLIAMVLLLAAASLTSQPPAADVLPQRASPAEVLEVFSPKKPRFVPPPYRELLAHSASSLDLFALPTAVDRIQSDFNHNVSGVFVVAVGMGAAVNRAGRSRLCRNWPLLFLVLALFLVLLAEPNGWPFGYEGFWETLVSPGVLQHRLATLLVTVLAFFQWRVETGRVGGRWRYGFPLLCLVGGALLLSHSHTVFAIKYAFLIELSHLAIGVLAVFIGVSRWLELRLLPPINRLPARLWPVCMMLVGYVLLVYRES